MDVLEAGVPLARNTILPPLRLQVELFFNRGTCYRDMSERQVTVQYDMAGDPVQSLRNSVASAAKWIDTIVSADTL
jgi:hypothetical protein